MDPDQKQMWKLAGRYGAVGLELGISVFLGFLVGRWLDEQAGTDPYLMVLFVVLGAAAGIRSLVRLVRRTDLDKM